MLTSIVPTRRGRRKGNTGNEWLIFVNRRRPICWLQRQKTQISPAHMASSFHCVVYTGAQVKYLRMLSYTMANYETRYENI